MVITLSFLLLPGNQGVMSNARADTGDASLTRVVFRLDDYSERSDTDLEIAIIRAFAERGLQLVVSVVPQIVGTMDDETFIGPFLNPDNQNFVPLGDEKSRTLRHYVDEQTVEVALHGYTHRTHRSSHYSGFERLDHSEFAGVPYAEQLRRIGAGKAQLESKLGLEVTAFVPPWNTWDVQTLRALERNDIQLLSANLSGDFENSATQSLRYLPITIGLAEANVALEQRQGDPRQDSIVVVGFHHYDFVENDSVRGITDLASLESLLDRVAANPTIETTTFGALLASGVDLGADRKRENTRLFRLSLLLPDALTAASGMGREYYERPVAASLVTRVATTVVLYYLAVVLVGLFAALWSKRILASHAPSLLIFARYGAIALTIGLSLYASRGDLQLLGATASMIAFGVTLGMWFGPGKRGSSRALGRDGLRSPAI